MTKTMKASITAIAASALLFVSGLAFAGFTADKNMSADASDTNKHSATKASVECTHAYEAKEIEATCTEQGYTFYTCADCGDEQKDNYIDVKGHDYTETNVAATCTEQGYILYVCNDCGDTYTETTSAAKGHILYEVVVPQTCTHKGYTTHFCTICGYEYTDSFLDEYKQY